MHTDSALTLSSLTYRWLLWVQSPQNQSHDEDDSRLIRQLAGASLYGGVRAYCQLRSVPKLLGGIGFGVASTMSSQALETPTDHCLELAMSDSWHNPQSMAILISQFSVLCSVLPWACEVFAIESRHYRVRH
jgi:uncharacterized membrane protein (UPF0136 family)